MQFARRPLPSRAVEVVTCNRVHAKGATLAIEKETFDHEVARLNALSVQELYAELAPADAAYDLNGRIAAGKEILNRVLKQGRTAVCKTYRENKSARHTSDLVKLLTQTLEIVVAAAGLKVPVIPTVVLLLKIGLEKLCVAPPK